ncbi:MAG: hypothetical protein J6M47_01825 [Clostridia bacterium]|nr:hypothetical protein [Clostridia bacterium]
MIRCPGCGNLVSEELRDCPSCGFNIASVTHSGTKSTAKNVAIFVAIALAVILAVVIYDACTLSADEAKANLERSLAEYKASNAEIERLERQLEYNQSLLDLYYGK